MPYFQQKIKPPDLNLSCPYLQLYFHYLGSPVDSYLVWFVLATCSLFMNVVVVSSSVKTSHFLILCLSYAYTFQSVFVVLWFSLVPFFQGFLTTLFEVSNGLLVNGNSACGSLPLIVFDRGRMC